MDARDELRYIIKIIRLRTGKTQQEISLIAGFNKGALADAVSRWKGHEDIAKRLKEVFSMILEDMPGTENSGSNPEGAAVPKSRALLSVAKLATDFRAQNEILENRINELEQNHKGLVIQFRSFMELITGAVSKGDQEQLLKLVKDIDQIYSQKSASIFEMGTEHPVHKQAAINRSE